MNFFAQKFGSFKKSSYFCTRLTVSISALKIKELREIATPFSFPSEQILVIYLRFFKYHLI